MSMPAKIQSRIDLIFPFGLMPGVRVALVSDAGKLVRLNLKAQLGIE